MSEHQVLEALKVLYDSSSDASERAVVSNYLSSFQRSLLSWNVTLNLLSRQDALPVVSQLFAAQTLKEKLRTQSFQLSQDSWQPVRSCIISVLQRPCEAALETQACLCLVTVIILLSISDDSCVSQLKPLISPLRLLRVMQLLAEEVAHDSSPYELVPGVDKVAWWLQAQKGAVAMAPAVFGVVSESLDTVRDLKQTNDAAPMDSQANGHIDDTQLEAADGEEVLTRGLNCAAAWFKLGVLLTMSSSSYEGVVQAALQSAASPSSGVSTAACEALTEAFERCPDQLLTHMQPQILELTAFALNSSRELSEEHQCQLLALISTYVQSSADTLVAGGRSDLIQKLFAAASVHAQSGVGNMAAAHAVDALVATGRAMQAAVKEEASSGVLPAHLQGLLQVCCEGLVGLLQVLQDTLVACVEEPSQANTALLEELQECYAIMIPLVGATTVCQALARVQGSPAGTCQSQARHNDQAPIAAMLTALASAPGALRSACKESASHSSLPASGSGAVQQQSSNLAQGLLQLMEQCRAQATHSDTPESLSIAAYRALFAAVPVFSPLLICEVNTVFTAAAPNIAASALQVLRTFSSGRKNTSATDTVHRFAAGMPSNGQFLRSTSDDSTGGMESDRTHRMHDFQARRSSDRMHGDDTAEGSQSMHVLHAPASVAMASLIAALQGSEKELAIVDETVAVVNAVHLPSQSDGKLLLAAFTASVQAGSLANGDSNHNTNPAALCQDSGLVGVAWRIVESVAHDAQQAVHQMAAHVQARGASRQIRTSIDSTCMDSQPSVGAQNGSVSASGEPGAAGEQSELLDAAEVLLKHLNRAVVILGAARSKSLCVEDPVDSDTDLIDYAECPQPPAVSLHLLSQLCSLIEPLAVVLSSPGVCATITGPLRRVWGKATIHAIALDARAAESLLPCVFKVVSEAASVDVLVDWHDLLAAMMDAYLPRDAGFSQTADRILTALQTIWTLSELQALPCPCEADMIPEVSVASSMLCIHVARSALTSTSCLSMESVCPLIEVGMARCSMAASASLRHVASAALSALLSMLSAAASLPERSLSPVAGCVLRGGGTMMMGFACALTAPGAGNRVTKLTQLLLQLAALVARAVPLLSQPPLVALHPSGLPLSVPAFPTSQPSQPRGNTPLSPAAVTQGVSYVLLWLKHALACLRPGMLQAHTPASICAAWQPFLSQALLAGVPAPVSLPGAAAPVATGPGAVWQAVVGHAFPGGVENSAALTVPSSAPATAPSIISQQPGFVGSASPFVGLPAAATPMSLPPGASAWGSLGAGVRFGSALRADTPFAAQLTANMITASALTDHNCASSQDSEAFHLNEALASPACRSLKKAVRAVVLSIGGRCSSSTGHNVGDLLSSSTPAVAAAVAAGGMGGMASLNGMRTSASPLLPAQQQMFAQQALCVPGGSIAQPVFPFVPHVVAGAMAPAQLHVPMGSPHFPAQQPSVMHSMSPTTVAVAAAPGHATQVTSSFNAPFFATSAPAAAAAAPTAYFAAPAFPTDRLLQPQAATPNISTLRSSEAQAIVQCSLATGTAGAGRIGLSMAPLAQQLQAVAIAGPASNKVKPFLGMETDENAR